MLNSGHHLVWKWRNGNRESFSRNENAYVWCAVCAFGGGGSGVQCGRTSCPPDCMVLGLAIPLTCGPRTKCPRPGQDVPPLINSSTTFPVIGSWVCCLRTNLAKVLRALSHRGWHAAMLCLYWHQIDVQLTENLNLPQKTELVLCSRTLVGKRQCTWLSRHTPGTVQIIVCTV